MPQLRGNGPILGLNNDEGLIEDELYLTYVILLNLVKKHRVNCQSWRGKN
jgi:hypothetical protein